MAGHGVPVTAKEPHAARTSESSGVSSSSAALKPGRPPARAARPARAFARLAAVGETSHPSGREGGTGSRGPFFRVGPCVAVYVYASMSVWPRPAAPRFRSGRRIQVPRLAPPSRYSCYSSQGSDRGLGRRIPPDRGARRTTSCEARSLTRSGDSDWRLHRRGWSRGACHGELRGAKPEALRWFGMPPSEPEPHPPTPAAFAHPGPSPGCDLDKGTGPPSGGGHVPQDGRAQRRQREGRRFLGRKEGPFPAGRRGETRRASRDQRAVRRPST